MILVVLGVVLVVLGVVLVVLGGSRLSFLMKRFLIKGGGVYRASRTGPGPPGQVQDLQEHLQDVQEELQDHF